MLAVLTEPVEVHLTGGSDLTGQIVIAAAAVLGAVLTVREANRRHRKQLAHDRELRAQELAHDREMREQEEVRGVLVTVTEHVIQAMESLVELDSKVHALESVRAELQRLRDEEDESFPKKAEEVEEAKKDVAQVDQKTHRLVQGMIAFLTVLRLRLPAQDPITGAFNELDDAYEAWYDSVTPGIYAERTAEEKKEAESKVDLAAERYRDYIFACRVRFSTEAN